MKEVSIAGRKIGAKYPPYIIAELSANHNGDIGRALRILEEAKRAGADAVKLQTYRADTLTLDCDRPEFRVQGGLWSGQTLYELYESAHMPWEWHEVLFKRARELDITMFSSPFDRTAVDYLENLGAPAYKIASFEAIDLPLIRYVAHTGKPMIISTGMADKNEICEAITTARDAGCHDLIVLHCVSGYPAPPQDYNLATMVDMADRFGVLVGLSDHTIDNTVAVSSVALGACVIEKHVTLDRSGGGPDDSFSIEPAELQALCSGAGAAWSALGRVNYARKESEKDNLIFRRSLYIVRDIKAGEVFTEENVRSIRPGYGLAPKHLEEVLGKPAKDAVSRGTALKWDLVELGS
tara:strand:+ start:5997 stop:7052 length:1056 start_codon:yes stop_codon:yes gene_type:complete